MKEDHQNLINKKVEEMKKGNLPPIGGPIFIKEKNREAQRLIGELGSLKISIEESTVNIENLEKEKGGVKTETLEIGEEQEEIKTETLETGEEFNKIKVQKEKQKGELDEKKKELEETIKLKEELDKQKTEPVIEIKKPVEIKTEPIKEIKIEKPLEVVVEEKKDEIKKPEVVVKKTEEPKIVTKEEEPEKILEGYTPLVVEDISKLKVGDEVIEINLNFEGGIVKKRVEKDGGDHFELSGPGTISRIEKGKGISEIVKAEEIKEPEPLKTEIKETEIESKFMTPEDMVRIGIKTLNKQEEEKIKKEEPVKPTLPPKKTEGEVPLETRLNEARGKYAEGYKQFMAERKKQSNFIVVGWRKVFGSKVKEEKIPQELKNLEKDYDKLTADYGRKMYADKKAELEKSGKPTEEQEKELTQFKQKEIFTKVILEEQGKLNALKAENLPPREKGILKKSLDWYLKQNRFTKVAISTALSTAIIASFLPSSIAAAGGITAYLGTKYARGLIGGIVGQVAAKGYEKLVKEKYTEKKEKALEELSKKFGKNMTDKELFEYKKEYAKILEKEQTSKRNRIIHKALVAITVGGVAGYGTGIAAHHLSPEQVLAGETPHRTNISDQMKEREIIDHPKTDTGGGTTEEIEHQPEVGEEIGKGTGIQNFMKTNAIQNAIKLGMYNPDAPAESLNVQSGTMSFDDGAGHHVEVEYSPKGAIQTIENLKAKIIQEYGEDMTKIPSGTISTHFVDIKGVEHDQVLIEGDNVEQIKDADMLDSDKNATPASTTDTSTTPSHTTSDAIIAPKPVAQGDIYTTEDNIIAPKHVGETETLIEKTPEQTLENQNQTTPTDTKTFDATEKNVTTAVDKNVVDLGDNPFHLSAEMLKEVQTAYDKLIDHLFHDNASLQAWNGIKDSTENYSAEKLMAWDETNVNETFKPLIHDIHTIHEITGLDPQGKTLIHLAETPTEFLKHGLEKAAIDGNLEELKTKLLAL